MMKVLDTFAEMYPTHNFREVMEEVLALGFKVKYMRELDHDPDTDSLTIKFSAICADPPICATGATVEECRDAFLSKVPPSYRKGPFLRIVPPREALP